MTNFILHDGTMVDHGQKWAIVLYTDTFVGTVTALYPKTEKIILEFDTISLLPSKLAELSQPGHDGLYGTTWNLMWSAFEEGYRFGTIYRHKPIEPKTRIPPYSFT